MARGTNYPFLVSFRHSRDTTTLHIIYALLFLSPSFHSMDFAPTEIGICSIVTSASHLALEQMAQHSASNLSFLSVIPVSHVPPMLHRWVDVDDRWRCDGQDAESALPRIVRHIIL
ncbi:hypothetical protein M422DRAFT_25598 [Sphaerobolus stellatus SS14]|nr:hypothetical protein M422DRAFT_25598 [Sphaerobolus stellatus SS14]